MPRGRSKRPPQPAPKDIVGLPVVEATYEQVSASLSRAVERAIATEGDATKKKVLEALPDALDGLVALATGIKVMNVEGTAYSVPPHVGSIKYLLDWGRALLGQNEQQTRTVHEISPETRALLRDWMQADSPPPLLPAAIDGVIHLED